ncbi:hypothetical protein BVG81_001405 [Haliangium sp. UPWRP_2]|nr:hypothetical protein BVG81_001405 [Haliangium sp. UPWRP_2]
MTVLVLSMALLGQAAAEGSRRHVPRGAAQRASAFARLYERGMRHYATKEYVAAIDALGAAYQVEQKPPLLFYLARCHIELGHAEDALRLYALFEPLANNPPAELRKQMQEDKVRAQALLDAAEQLDPVPPVPFVPAAGDRRPPSPGIDVRPPNLAERPTPIEDDLRPLVPTAQPVYRRWWFWTALGGGVAVAAVAVVVAATRVWTPQSQRPAIPSDVYSPEF